MIQQWTDRLVSRMIENGVIEEEKKALYAFGMEQGVRTLLEIVLMLITAMLLKVFWQGVIMIVSFCPIRAYAGGYHAKTPLQCALKSWLMFVAFLLWLRYLPYNLPLQLVVVVVTGFFLVVLCPMPDEHRPLEDFEVPRYRKCSFLLYGIETIIYIASLLLENEWLSRSIVCGMGMLLIVWCAYLVLGKRIKKKK